MRPDILHVDLDAFYVSVERLRDPSLRSRPVVVGGDGVRGVVLSCSYETRKHGVRNGMPSMRAKRLCPEAVFVPPTFSDYTEHSKRFRAVLDAVTPLVEPISLDEAFCDVSGAHRLWGSSEEIAGRIREGVREECGLVCSVGGGPSKLVAKLASKACKPDGVLVVHDVAGFMRPLAIEELWGVGAATAATLHRIGIRTVGDLADAPVDTVRRALGDGLGPHLHRLAQGIDRREVVTTHEPKSVGAEETFPEDLDDPERLGAELLRLADRVASRLVAKGLSARTVTVKIRLSDFETHTRSKTLDDPTSDVWTIGRVAQDAFDSFRRGRRRVRLLGVSASGLVSGPVARQLTLEGAPPYAEAEKALERVRERFGKGALRLARLVDPDSGSAE